MSPIRTMYWNKAWQINADIPGREGYHQTVTLPNYCNEGEAKVVESVIRTAHKRHVAFLSEQSEVKNEHL